MMNTQLEELMTTLYDTIQDAKSLPLSADKCIIERDKVLDLLDELENLIPGELKQAQTIIASREELVAQARKEAETIIRNAHEQAEKLVEKNTIFEQTKAKCQELAEKHKAECDERTAQTESQMAQLKAASFGYMDDSLRQTEETIAGALEAVRAARSKFQSVTAPKTEE